jgi:hypothetical protein
MESQQEHSKQRQQNGIKNKASHVSVCTQEEFLGHSGWLRERNKPHLM